ncbi:threonine transporter [Tistrella mobilis]|uniref:Threonine transporter n=1 Tax=Tistrella mobilis TaxID=171437 RepID=A0A162K4Y3_9PROT|nr:ABC-three component system middle component 2 [Tistrella mobilis]KYO50488.1 threonine transporter [Tistrella mobilis]
MADKADPNPFNSALETGVRSVAILVAAFPSAYDIQRLVEMDYLVVHSGDAEGPTSLHAPLPLRAGELLVRRSLIESGLRLMMSRSLVRRLATAEGISYVAGDSASPYLAALTSDYISVLRMRADWAVDRFRGVPTDEIRQITQRLFERWSSQFQPIQTVGQQQ